MSKTLEDVWKKFTIPSNDTIKTRFRHAIAASVETILPPEKEVDLMWRAGKKGRASGFNWCRAEIKANAAAFLENKLMEVVEKSATPSRGE